MHGTDMQVMHRVLVGIVFTSKFLLDVDGAVP